MRYHINTPFLPSSSWYPQQAARARFTPFSVRESNQITPETSPSQAAKIISDRLLVKVQEAVQNAIK